MTHPFYDVARHGILQVAGESPRGSQNPLSLPQEKVSHLKTQTRAHGGPGEVVGPLLCILTVLSRSWQWMVEGMSRFVARDSFLSAETGLLCLRDREQCVVNQRGEKTGS